MALGMAATSDAFWKSVVAPILRIETLLQVDGSIRLLSKERRSKGIVDCFKRVSREQGLRSFWRGNTANCLACYPSLLSNFAFKDMWDKIFGL